MGCSNSKQVSIQELTQMIAKLEADNKSLKKEAEKLKTTIEEKPEDSKTTLKDIKELQSELESYLKLLNLKVSQVYESSVSSSLTVSDKVTQILNLKTQLDKKTEKIVELVKTKEEFKKQQEDLEKEINFNESKIKEFETLHFSSDELRTEHFNIYKKVAELEDEKDKILAETAKAEKNISEINNKLRGFDNGFISQTPNPNTPLGQLNSSDIDVGNQLKRVDSEIEALSGQMKKFKFKESEVLNIDKQISFIKTKPNFKKNENLKNKILASQERIEILETEKKKLKNEIGKLKGTSLEVGLSEKLNELNSILDKKKPGNKDEWIIKDALVLDVEETLKKARKFSTNNKELE